MNTWWAARGAPAAPRHGEPARLGHHTTIRAQCNAQRRSYRLRKQPQRQLCRKHCVKTFTHGSPGWGSGHCWTLSRCFSSSGLSPSKFNYDKHWIQLTLSEYTTKHHLQSNQEIV